jgi:hypothetical protein
MPHQRKLRTLIFLRLQSLLASKAINKENQLETIQKQHSKHGDEHLQIPAPGDHCY